MLLSRLGAFADRLTFKLRWIVNSAQSMLGCGGFSWVCFAMTFAFVLNANASNCSDCDERLEIDVSVDAGSLYEWIPEPEEFLPFIYQLKVESGDDVVDLEGVSSPDPIWPNQGQIASDSGKLRVSVPSEKTPTKLKITVRQEDAQLQNYTGALKFPKCYRKFDVNGTIYGLEEGLPENNYYSSPIEYPLISVGEVDDGVILSFSYFGVGGNFEEVLNVSMLNDADDAEDKEAGSGGGPGTRGGSGGGGPNGYGSNTSAGTTSAGNGGQGAGNTVWSTEDIANATDLDTVKFTASSSVLGIDKVETSSTSQKQLYVADMSLVNVSSSGGVLTIGYYSNAQVGSIDSNGFYTFSGTPYKEIVVTQTSSTTATYVTKENGVTVGSWTLGGGSGTQIVDNYSNRKEVNTGGVDVNGDRTETREIWYTPTNQLVTKSLRVYKTFSVDEDSNSGTPDVTWEKLIREVNDPDGAALTTTHTYETNPSSANYKKVVSTTYPDGNWSYVSAAGVIWQPFKDGVNGTTPPTSVPANSATGYVRRVSGTNGASESFINGNLVAKTEASSTLAGQTFGGVSGLSKVTHNRVFGTGSSDKLESASYYYSYSEPVEYLRGKLFASVEADGTCTKYEYAQGTYSAGTFTVGTGTDSKTVAMRGYVSSGVPVFVSNKSTARETIENARGQSLQERELLWNGTDFSTVLTTTQNSYNANGRLTKIERLTSADPNWITVFAATYDARGNMTSSTDAFGVISTSITEGRTTTLTNTDGYITRTNVVIVDVAGRVISETGDGLTTTYAYSTASNGGKRVTKTLPSGATSITEYYLDGQLKNISGTGEVSRTFDYGAGTGERSSSVTTSGRTVTTLSDMMGRTKQVTKPKFGGGTSTTASTYNGSGQLISETIDGGAIAAPRVYAYDNLGAMIRYGFDIDGSGLSTSGASPDRVSENEQYHAQSGGNWFSVSKAAKYLPTGIQFLQETWNRVDGRETIVKSGDRTVTTTTAVDPSDSSNIVVSTLDSDLGSPSIQVFRRGVTLVESRPPWQIGPTEKTTYTYTAGRLSKITDALGRETTITYVPQGTNGAGAVWVKTEPGGATIEKSYNSLGLVDTESGTGTYWKKFGYNDVGELTTFQTHGAAGIATTTWRREVNTGLVDRKVDAVGKFVEYTYNAVSWPVSRTWARGVITTYGYNAVGDVNSINYSDETPDATDMEYDKGGRLVEVTDASGKGDISYSNFGDRATETYSGTGILSGYEVTRGFSQQRRTSLAANGPSGFTYPAVSYNYNSGTRVNTIIQGSLSTTYTPKVGMLQPTSVNSTWSGGITLERIFGYDALGRTTSLVSMVGAHVVGASGTPINPIVYDIAGHRTQIAEEDGSRWDYGYNPRDEVTSGKKMFADNSYVPGHQFTYNYDGIGNRNSAEVGGNSLGTALHLVSFTPNFLNQYSDYTTPQKAWITGEASTTATVTINGASAWRHSEFFGREIDISNELGPVSKSVTVTASLAPNAGSMISASKTGEVLFPPATVAQTYDDDGNLTSDGLWNYSWDGENRLKSIETVPSASSIVRRKQNYSYDCWGRLIKITRFEHTGSGWVQDNLNSKVMLFDGWNIIGEITGSSTQTYLWGLDISGTLNGAGGIGGYLAMSSTTSSAPMLSVLDDNGNTLALIESVDGRLVAQYGYGPFGEPIVLRGEASSLNSIRFSSKYSELETGLVYYGYRFYSPTLGRWLNRDPFEENGGSNLYAFSFNNPVSFFDPLGLWVMGPPGTGEMRGPSVPPQIWPNPTIPQLPYISPYQAIRLSFYEYPDEEQLTQMYRDLQQFTYFNPNFAGAVSISGTLAKFSGPFPLSIGQILGGWTLGYTSYNEVDLSFDDTNFTVTGTTRPGHVVEGWRKWKVERSKDEPCVVLISTWAHERGGGFMAEAIRQAGLVTGAPIQDVTWYVYLENMGKHWESEGKAKILGYTNK